MKVSKFSVEFKTVNPNGEYLFGGIRFKIDEFYIGDIEDVTILTSIATSLAGIVRSDARYDVFFAGRNYISILNTVNRLLNCNDFENEDKYNESIKIYKIIRGCILSPINEPPFEWDIIVLLTGPKYDRILWRDKDKKNREFMLCREECVSEIRKFISWVNSTGYTRPIDFGIERP